MNERGAPSAPPMLRTGGKIMQKFKTLFRKSDWHTFIAYLVLLIFSWPTLTILESTHSNVVFFYLFGAWGLVIVLLLLIAISHRDGGSEQVESEHEV
jgi:cytochrome bd-type quinol oxidase subunit 2